jgi:hypothetical protein
VNLRVYSSVSSVVWVLVLLSCTSKPKEETTPAGKQVMPESGAALAKLYCGRCHLYPSPDLLDKETWEKHVLPNMGYRLGIYEGRTRDSLLEKGMARRIVENAGLFPATQMITTEKWNLIKQFYHDHAPEKLAAPPETSIRKTLPLFKAVAAGFKITRPAVTAITSAKDARTIFVADCSQEDHSTVNILDSRLKLISTLGLPHPVSNITVRSDTAYMLMMGHLIPSDEPAGTLIKAVKNEQGEHAGYLMVLKNLKRPVDVAYADIDDDSDDDIVVCEYGNHTGSVSLFRKERKNAYTKTILQGVPGAISVVIEDINRDDRPDIVVLMAQGDEGIDIFFNQGNGQFKKERVLRFPPVYGSVSFSLTDLNHDGYSDILYVNGDNADVSPVLKPYHGIRIFLNDQQNHFTESFFHPLHGAYKAIARDFDQDGDLDIAAIAFFPDFAHHPEQGFVYFENTSINNTLSFTAATFPEAANGRWISMEEADIDRDGDKDLLLGSFTSMNIPGDRDGAVSKKYFSENTTVLVLRNTLKR